MTLQQMPHKSLVVAFTNHQTKDLDLKDEILALKRDKSIEIRIILIPEYLGTPGDDSWNLYHEVGEVTVLSDNTTEYGTKMENELLHYIYVHCSYWMNSH